MECQDASDLKKQVQRTSKVRCTCMCYSEKLNLKKGDLVTFVETENGVLIKPAELVAVEALAEIGRALKAKGYSL